MILNHNPLIRHLVQSYADWWQLRIEMSEANGFWILQGSAHTMRIPIQPEALTPTTLVTVAVRIGDVECPLPAPGSLEAWRALPAHGASEYPADVLTFLAGQLWRAEELLPAHIEAASHANYRGFLGDRFGFFDKPVVDLWMRHILECLEGRVLSVPKAWSELQRGETRKDYPRFWMTYDIDCLRKWTRVGVLKHIAKFPLDVMNGHLIAWFRSMREAILAHFPERDPWYTLPQIFQATKTITATIFWLGHPRDHKAYRYDVRRPEYAKLLRTTLQETHQLGLHGSPLHADNPAALVRERQRLESIALDRVRLHRQHYLRIAPEKTFRHLEAMGIALDSTMGFNDRCGFRCGSCIPVRWWDFGQGCALNMLELPFAVGDWTLHNPLHFEPNESRHRIWNFADQVKLAGGILVLDFHELYFSKDYPDHAEFHQSVLEGFWTRGWRDWHPEIS